MKKELVGTGVALVTPFDEKGNVDHMGLANLVTHCIGCGVEYLVLLGTTAESVTLSKEEKQAVKETIIQTNNGQLPLVLGIGGNNTAEVVNEIQKTDLEPFTAILSVSPYYNKPTQEGIFQHFASIAQSTQKDIILYNVPGRTSSNILPETTIRLAQEFENIVAIKEASPNFLQSTEIIKDKPEEFMVLSGDDELAVPMILAGAQGVISVIGQAIPDYSDMIREALNHNINEAYEHHYQLMDLIRSIYIEGNPAGIKALLEIQGVCKKQVRLPLVEATDNLTEKIEKLYNAVIA